MNSFLFRAAGLSVAAPMVLGAQSDAAAGPDFEKPIGALDAIVVTANRSGQTLFEQVQPATVLTGRDLLKRMAPTLGETLNREPGVSSTYFGPGASRPVVRGLGDDRVRILQNGTSVLDVSNVSPDHAVALDPLSMQAVEVVRGPATLLYGPNTMGGVVNVMDDRIAKERFEGPWPSGRLGLMGGSADELFSQSGALTWGTGPWVFHLDGFNRETEDIEIPGFARSERLRLTDPAGTPQPYGTLPNSATHSKGAGVGISYVGDAGYLGISYSGMDSTYGTVAEPDVTIGLRQRRYEMRGAWWEPTSWAKELSFSLGYSDYEHTEFEGVEPGTQFLIEGFNGRVEMLHHALAGMEGAVGYETQMNEFSALGSEAFLPTVDNETHSVFFFEEMDFHPFRLQFGARYDHQSNETETNPLFGPGLSRDFDAFSGSVALVYEPVENYAATVAIGYAQRPPTYVELFADGPHVATGSYEIGDTRLGTEDVLSLDVSLKKNAGWVTGGVSGYYYRFSDYIGALPTGAFDPVDGFPIYAYRAVDADFYGGEIETVFHLLGPATGNSAEGADAKAPLERVAAFDSQLDLSLKADYVHAENRSTHEPLPRIPPFRFTAGLDYTHGGWGANVECQYAADQNRTASFELPTDGYVLVNAGLDYTFTTGQVETTVFLKGTNLTQEEARISTSFLKDSAPLAGRGVVVGVSTRF
ncbi:iron complex outermembrane receptor protein [Haloferula luteola]|uniref:Iron complex outermembrane receptor protein n=1 Tax=Haloferula luteola TaxID=595692 RepID=A0A840VB19_9BACT|nr:TonB-dependent receptor [Haloferula luteola]MBB5350999.1 iron complex outermembrane receptor protein [Haloferula luteola]